MNPLSQQAAKQLTAVYFGGNWTGTNVRDVLNSVTYREATATSHGFNSLLALAYHQFYFITALKAVLSGQPLTTKDELSFNHPAINNEEEWRTFLNHVYSTVKETAALLSELPDEQLNQPFSDPKYGSWYYNIHGIIEHIHYHLGQMSIIRKLKSPGF